MTLVLTIIIFALIITLLVFIHELGHFLAAKFSGVEVHEFAIGFGPTLFLREYKGTVYKINALPLGGYVQLEGENDNSIPNSFRNKGLKVKAIVLMAGIFMNLVLAIILLGIYLGNNSYRFAIPKIVDYQFSNVQSQRELFPLFITFVDQEGPSKDYLKEGEILVGANGINFKSTQEFLQILKDNQNSIIPFEFIDFATFNTSIRDIPIGTADENGAILKAGLSPYDTQTGRPTYFLKYNEIITAGFSMTVDAFFYQFRALGALVGDAVTTGDYQEISNSVGGLPAIGNQVGQLVEFRAFDVLIPLTALFSVNLAMFNILPFPALDGGQLLFAFIERVRRKKFSDEFLNKVNFAGFAFLMGLGLLVTLKDIIQLNWLGTIWDGIRGVLGR